MRMAAIVVILGLIALGLIFGEEARAAVGVWIDSTAYGHCFFIVPIALFLAWERRRAAMATPVVPLPWLALLAVPMGVVWLAAERLGIMEGQQLLAMGFVELMFLCVLGWRMCWVLAVPLLYLFFLVPFGAFVTPALQSFTASFIIHGLNLLGIPNISDSYIIEIPEGAFFVAEACAGLRFLIASIAFGVLYACMIYRSPGRRIGFIARLRGDPDRGQRVSRAGHRGAWPSHRQRRGGRGRSRRVWLDLLQLRDPRADPGRPAVSRGCRPRADARLGRNLAAGTTCADLDRADRVAGAHEHRPCGNAGWLDRRASPPSLAQQAVIQTLGAIAGCGPLSQPTAAGGHLAWTAACHMNGPPGDQLTLTVIVWPSRANPGALARQRRVETGELQAEDSTVTGLRQQDDANWQLVNTTEPDRVIATAAWIDGRPARGGLAQRRLLAEDSVFGGDHGQILVTIATLPDSGRLSPQIRDRTRAAITALLDINPDLASRLVRLSEAVERGQ